MEAPLSTSSKLSNASGWTEVTGAVGLPFLVGGRLPVSETTEGSGAMFGPGPDWEPLGALLPLCLESGRSPCGASRSTSPWLGTLGDKTLALSVGRGVEAVGREPLFIFDEPNEPLDEGTSR